MISNKEHSKNHFVQFLTECSRYQSRENPRTVFSDKNLLSNHSIFKIDHKHIKYGDNLVF